jgi:vacuolar-type H+-ATPase subunit E/Vma4
MKTKKMMKDQLQKWLDKHVVVMGSDKKSMNVLKKVMHKTIREKLTSSVEPQATTELVERTNGKPNKTT